MRQTRRNQSRFWQWHAANSCKFSTLQENQKKKKRLGGWSCPTKGLEKNRNLSLSFEGLTLLKGSGPIIQKSESPTASAGKERHHQKIGSTVTRHSSIHKLTRKSPGRRVLAEPVDLGKHLLTLCICIYVTLLYRNLLHARVLVLRLVQQSQHSLGSFSKRFFDLHGGLPYFESLDLEGPFAKSDGVPLSTKPSGFSPEVGHHGIKVPCYDARSCNWWSRVLFNCTSSGLFRSTVAASSEPPKPQQKTQVVYGGVIVSLTKGIKQAILKDCLRFHCHFCHKHSKCLHTRL